MRAGSQGEDNRELTKPSPGSHVNRGHLAAHAPVAATRQSKPPTAGVPLEAELGGPGAGGLRMVCGLPSRDPRVQKTAGHRGRNPAQKVMAKRKERPAENRGTELAEPECPP